MQIYNLYRSDGEGLHSFTDKVDNQQYLYTQFEVDYARFVFPCFDQPDLKATWQLRGLIPEDWDIISNEYQDAAKVEEHKASGLMTLELKEVASVFQCMDIYDSLANGQIYNFTTSAKISTYLYVIVAGPYSYFESNVEGMPPMRIYCRKSVMSDV